MLQKLYTSNWQRNIIYDNVPYYKYDPANVTENNKVKIYWDREIHTDVKINAKRPDLILYNKEIAIPLNSNIQKTYATKISKYNELAQEIKNTWKVKNVHI
jgi:hypothetical protein